ncbi:MAG: hypothetical protein D4R64_16425 [Porphyromonadaceae bacterium]|nr:MAG: hypothetical protein D4R64_16425 [Porphyromonadaceae bacterium]
MPESRIRELGKKGQPNKQIVTLIFYRNHCWTKKNCSKSSAVHISEVRKGLDFIIQLLLATERMESKPF